MPRPYNLYFTPDGRSAVVMVEQHDTVRFSDPKTFKVRDVVSPRGCRGPNHADFSANGRFFVVTCEFSGELVKINTLNHRVMGTLALGGRRTTRGGDSMRWARSMPQDIRLSPDGRIFYVADMGTNELRLVRRADVNAGRGHRPALAMPHGIYPSRDGKVSTSPTAVPARSACSTPRRTRSSTPGRSPAAAAPTWAASRRTAAMLWLSGRYDGVSSTASTPAGPAGRQDPGGGSPHGMAVWPQPGRYSLGHTGNMR